MKGPVLILGAASGMAREVARSFARRGHPIQLAARDPNRLTEDAADLTTRFGVEVSLLNQEWKVFLKTRKQKIETQVFRAGWIGDYNDPNTFAELMHSANGLNDPGYVNPRFDELVDGAAVEVDRERRRAMLEEAEAELLRDLPIAPIYFYVTKRLVKPYVVGYEDNIMNHHYTKDLDLIVQ